MSEVTLQVEGPGNSLGPSSRHSKTTLPQRTKEEKAAYMREWRQRNPRSDLNIVLKKLYGISLERYEAMLDAQGGVCAICQTTGPNDQRLCVDHDHTTGAIRGLLCQKCNTALGMLKDDIALVSRARDYLARHL